MHLRGVQAAVQVPRGAVGIAWRPRRMLRAARMCMLLGHGWSPTWRPPLPFPGQRRVRRSEHEAAPSAPTLCGARCSAVTALVQPPPACTHAAPRGMQSDGCCALAQTYLECDNGWLRRGSSIPFPVHSSNRRCPFPNRAPLLKCKLFSRQACVVHVRRRWWPWSWPAGRTCGPLRPAAAASFPRSAPPLQHHPGCSQAAS